MINDKPVKVVFQPGCFDGFEGTQEELDQLQADILAMAQSGELLEQSQLVDLEALSVQDPELVAKLLEQLSDGNKRNLQ